ncbi:MAG: hypothetical protein HQK76_05935 [Desulfobacterales bacterium]|nr:hypothetical protein [Desulfobacterales bacterium]
MKKIYLFLSLIIAFFVILEPNSFGNKEEEVQKSITEQQIYIPYEKFADAISNQKKGVFVPYSDFLRLWEESSKKPIETFEQIPPVDASIISSYYEGEIKDETVVFHGELRISAIKDKWAKLPFNIDNIAITSLSLLKSNETSNSKFQVPILQNNQEEVNLIIPEKGDYILKLDFTSGIQKIQGKKNISFKIPDSPLTKVDLFIPSTDIDINIEPLLSKNISKENNKTKLSAFLSPSGVINISWFVKTEEEKLNPLVFADIFSKTSISESVYAIKTEINFSIMQAKTDTFKIKFPKFLNIVKINGDNIKEWDVSEDGILKIVLHEKIIGAYSLEIFSEQFRKINEIVFNYPSIEVLNVSREIGIITVKADSSFMVKLNKTEKISQIDFSEIKEKISEKDAVYAFKYYRHPFVLEFLISEIKPKVNCTQNISIILDENSVGLKSEIKYEIKDAGIFNLKILIPENFRVTQIGTKNNVESFSVSEPDKTGKKLLTINLKNKAYGNLHLPLYLESDNKSLEISFDKLKIECLDAERETGIIGISIRKNLKLLTQDAKGLKSLSIEELLVAGFKNEDLRNEWAAGYSYYFKDYSGSLIIEKRNSMVTALLERTILIEEALIKTIDNVSFKILYAPINKFRIEVSDDIGQSAYITGEKIKEKRFQKDEVTNKWIYEIELHEPVIDNYLLKINFEKKISEIKIGEAREIKVPQVRILDVFNESGWIGISKTENLQIETEYQSLEPVDPKELPKSMESDRMSLSYKYLSHPYSLALKTTRYDYEKILSALCTYSHFDIVVSEEGEAKAEAVYRIKNANRQSLSIEMPKEESSIYAVYISGKKASISKGSSKTSKIIMLPKDIPLGQEFTLRIVYQFKLRDKFGIFGALKIKGAELDIPTLKTYWRLYLPAAYKYLYLKGSIQPEYQESSILGGYADKITYGRNRVNIDEQQILKQDDEQQISTLDIDIIREGKLHKLSKLDKDAYINGIYIKNSSFITLSIILLLLSGIIFWYSYFIILIKEFYYFIFILFGLFVLKLFIPEGFKHFIWMIIYGVIISRLVIFGYLYYKER